MQNGMAIEIQQKRIEKMGVALKLKLEEIITGVNHSRKISGNNNSVKYTTQSNDNNHN